jgi:hypothetical protein
MQAGDTCQVAAAFKERVVRERACQSDGSGLHGQQPKALQQVRTLRDGSRQCLLVRVKKPGCATVYSSALVVLADVADG